MVDKSSQRIMKKLLPFIILIFVGVVSYAQISTYQKAYNENFRL